MTTARGAAYSAFGLSAVALLFPPLKMLLLLLLEGDY